MRHEDGHCDECGCEIGWPGAQLMFDGSELCMVCAVQAKAACTQATRPEARDDGR